MINAQMPQPAVFSIRQPNPDGRQITPTFVSEFPVAEGRGVSCTSVLVCPRLPSSALVCPRPQCFVPMLATNTGSPASVDIPGGLQARSVRWAGLMSDWICRERGGTGASRELHFGPMYCTYVHNSMGKKVAWRMQRPCSPWKRTCAWLATYLTYIASWMGWHLGIG
jgi:hypothetical protein